MPGAVFQSALQPASPQAASIHSLWILMLIVSTVVFVVTLAFVAAALVRGSRRASDAGGDAPSLARGVSLGTALTVLVLFGLLFASVRVGRRVASLQAASAVSVNVVGHQWWWEIEYEDSQPDRRVVTANELHIPVGRPVVLKVTSRDVIHSFWAPNLQGKRDLIPGYTTAIWLSAERAGTFRGQCAEFCGMQHAHMAFDIVAEPEREFDRWLAAMRQPSSVPQGRDHQRGRDVFMQSRCAVCHTISGTEAHGQAGPDLTHVGSRSTIGAGTLANTPDQMALWIRDPQAVKPGNQMPANPLAEADLRAVVSYLAALQ